MPAPNTITPDKLNRLIGTPNAPLIVDVRTTEDFDADPLLLPCSTRKSHRDAETWSRDYQGRDIVVICHKGLKLSHGTAAWLRHAGADAVSLEGGFEAWKSGGLPLVPVSAMPPRNAQGSTVWVTRSRPKIDRIACPWLIKRFVDPQAVFLFVAPSEVRDVADRFQATAFDIEDTYWSHDGALCTFDKMVSAFGLATAPMQRLATIVRAADTARLDLAPEAAGLLAVSLGLSRMHSDDLQQLESGLTVYDALYRWCRDATDETHNWPSAKAKA